MSSPKDTSNEASANNVKNTSNANVSKAGASFTRRAILAGGAATAVGYAAIQTANHWRKSHAEVFIARHQRYDGPLAQTIHDGLLSTGFADFDLRGKRVLLKPNLVEPTKLAPHMTTHPAMVAAAVEAFRKLGAIVHVGEAPGHVRDTQMAVLESGIDEALREANVSFADLNYEDTGFVSNRGKQTKLAGLYFPKTVLEADLVVSMPKLKTHHWAGMTAAMKNFFGILPGIKYGWPKNVLHHAGIGGCIFDINATLPKTAAIVDAIDCMEGDGPILGSRKSLGLVLVSGNLPAVDATCARIMGFAPERIDYLKLASDRLGPIAENRIRQRGEAIREVRSPFQVLPHMQKLCEGASPLVT